jgi:hypothetical protein
MASINAAELRAAKKHNNDVLRSATKGDLLEFPRVLYSHWAVYVGNGRVIHLAGEPEDACAPKDVSVRESSFWTVARTSLTKINNSFDRTERPLPPEEIVERARSKIGERGFSLLFTNCEHFVTWCRYNKARSTQVESFDQFLSAFGTGMKLGLTMVAHGHQDEKVQPSFV